MSYDYKILSKLRVFGYKVYKIWNGKSLYTYTKDNKVCGIVDAENRYMSEVRYTQVYAYQNIALCEQEHREDIKHIYYNCKMYDIFELLKLEPKNARATSVFCILPMVITTAIFYGQSNFIKWDIGIMCAIGGIIGGIVGAKLLNRLPEKYLKIAFAMFLIYAGINMIIR